MYMLFKKTLIAKPRRYLPGSCILSFIPHREFFLIFAVNRRLLAVRFVTSKSVCSQIYWVKYRIIHGRTEIWNLSSSVHIDIERVSAANE